MVVENKQKVDLIGARVLGLGVDQVGWIVAAYPLMAVCRGKSALRRAWCRLTAGQGDLMASATERRPLPLGSKGERVV